MQDAIINAVNNTIDPSFFSPKSLKIPLDSHVSLYRISSYLRTSHCSWEITAAFPIQDVTKNTNKKEKKKFTHA